LWTKSSEQTSFCKILEPQHSFKGKENIYISSFKVTCQFDIILFMMSLVKIYNMVKETRVGMKIISLRNSHLITGV